MFVTSLAISVNDGCFSSYGVYFKGHYDKITTAKH